MLFRQGHALVIGVGSYQNAPHIDVPIVVEDARAVANVIRDEELCGYPENQVEVLPNDKATRKETLAALERLRQRTGEQDTVFLFYCGHGALGTDGNYYLVSRDAEIEGDRVVAGSGVSEGELIEKLRDLKAQRALLIFNTCHSGSISPTLEAGAQKIKSKSLSTDTTSAILGTGSGRIIITACREDQKSYIGKGSLSIFTQALVDGLRGKGVSNNRGYISAYSLYEQIYFTVTERVGELSTNLVQEPELTMIKNHGPFAVALYKGASALGEFDESQVEVKTPAVHSVTPEKAQRSFKQVIEVGSGAASVGNGAIAVGQNGMFIGGNVDGPVYNIRDGVHAGRNVVMGNQSNVITNQAQPQNQAEFTAALQALKAEIAVLRQQADLNTAQRSNLDAAHEKVVEAAGQAQQPGAPGWRIRGALEEAKEIMDLLGGGLQAAVVLGARIATLAGLVAKLFGG